MTPPVVPLSSEPSTTFHCKFNVCLLCNIPIKHNSLAHDSDEAQHQQHQQFIKIEVEETYFSDQQQGQEPSLSNCKKTIAHCFPELRSQQQPVLFASNTDTELINFAQTHFSIITRISELEDKSSLETKHGYGYGFCQQCSGQLSNLRTLESQLRTLQKQVHKLKVKVAAGFNRTYLRRKEELKNEQVLQPSVSAAWVEDPDQLATDNGTRIETQATDPEFENFAHFLASDDLDDLNTDTCDDAYADSAATATDKGSSIPKPGLAPCYVILQRMDDDGPSLTKLKQEDEDVDFRTASSRKRKNPPKTKSKGPYKCEFCSKLYSKRYWLNLHRPLHKGVKFSKPYPCPNCPASFNKGYRLSVHMLIHTGQKPHQCSVCGKKFRKSNQLGAHMLSHTKVKGQKCHLCPESFIYRTTLKKHLANVHDIWEKCFPCTLCPKKCLWEAQLARHLAEVHAVGPKLPKRQEKPRIRQKRNHARPALEKPANVENPKQNEINEIPFQLEQAKPKMGEPTQRRPRQANPAARNYLKKRYCDACPAHVFSTSALLEEHRRAHHSIGENDEGLLKCEKCGITFVSQPNYERHCVGCAEGKPICLSCGQPFELTVEMEEHRRIVHKGRRFQCEFCGNSYTERWNMVKHIRAAHYGIRPYSCEHCDVSFPSMIELRLHSVTHTGIKPFPCNFCEERFSKAARKRQHMVQAHGEVYLVEEPAVCVICWKNFKNDEELSSHKRKVHEKFKCQICGRVFANGTRLQNHGLIHTGEKPHQCAYCSKFFSRAENLKEHLYRHTGERPHHCPLCNMGFFRKKELRKHEQCVHDCKYSPTRPTPKAATATAGFVPVGMGLGSAAAAAPGTGAPTAEMQEAAKDIPSLSFLSF